MWSFDRRWSMWYGSSRQCAEHALYVGHVPDGFDHLRQMVPVADLKLDTQPRVAHVALLELHLVDVGLRFGNARRDRGEHTHAIVDLQLNLGGEQAPVRFLPGDRQPFLRLFAILGEVTAILPMDHD